MNIKARIILVAVSVVLTLLFGFLGGLLGPRLPWWLWPVGAAVLTFIAIPWSPVDWSQEDLRENVQQLNAAIEKLSKLTPQLRELEEKSQGKTLSLSEIKELSQKLYDSVDKTLEELSPEESKKLREFFFGDVRKLIAVQVIILILSALAGSALSYYFAQWLKAL